MSGKVYLVGAGPGDPELLTVRATRILAGADVVLHDGLVSGAIVKLAVRAQIINVGKRCGNNKIVTQEQINEMLVEFGLRGGAVVRLKGGDPLIFGRAAEEIAALRAAGIEYEIVPGVTTASCAAASAGMSLTYRKGASSLVFLTGHGGTGKSSGNEWPDLAPQGPDSPDATVVVYMPGSDPSILRDRLLAAGMLPSTPCLLVSGVSTPACQFHPTTVGDLANAPELPAPKVLIAGEVVRSARLAEEQGGQRTAEFEGFAPLLHDLYDTWPEPKISALAKKG
jgi:uroporphyrin-III C-methyltransferase